MQSAAFRAAGLDWTYDLLDVPPAELPDAIRKLRAPDAAGANVTIPYKLAVMEHPGVALEGAHMTFIARHPDRSGELPGRVAAWFDQSWESEARTADLLVNATPLGRSEEMPLRPNALPKEGAVIDLVYVAGGTPLIRKARSLGLRTADGWGVLVAQGARSFEIWTGKPAPVDAMREALTP